MDGLEMKLVDLKGLLLLRYKEFGISESELIVLEMLLVIEQTGMSNYHQILMEKTNLNSDQVDEVLLSLIRKKYLTMDGMKVELDYLKAKLITFDKLEENKPVDLLSLFEKEFGRGLSPTEMEAIRNWKQADYEDEMIIEALKEASMRGKFSMRYIEAILKDWAEHGIKRTGKIVNNQKKIPEYIQYNWWEEE